MSRDLGRRLATALIAAGVEAIIATAGTRDLPALRERRGQSPRAGTEPFIASALWLKDLGVPIFACGPTSDRHACADRAVALGLCGVVDWPSST